MQRAGCRVVVVVVVGLWEALDRSVCFHDSQLRGRPITADDSKLSRCVTQFSSQPLCLLSTINVQGFDGVVLTPSSHGIPHTLQEDIIFYGALMILGKTSDGEKIILSSI